MYANDFKDTPMYFTIIIYSFIIQAEIFLRRISCIKNKKNALNMRMQNLYIFVHKS